MLTATQCYVARGDISNETTSLNSSSGKAEIERRGNFENE